MDRVRIENLRVLEDTKIIELKPITLLLGANSSGKSTFLRTFPLLKQGRGVNKQGPILWYGTEVDFGSYEEALRNGADTMSLSFGWDKFSSEIKRIDAPAIIFDGIKVYCKIEIGSQGYNSYVKKLCLSIGENVQLDVTFNQSRVPTIHINGEDVGELIDIRSRISMGQILPIINIIPLVGEMDEEDFSLYPLFSEEYVSMALQTVSILSDLINDVDEISISNPFGTDGEILDEIVEITEISLTRKERATILSSESWRRFRYSLILFHLGGLLFDLDKTLQAELNGSVYIKPFRAYAERYYRKQNLAVKDLDSDGHNMAMIIDNMSRKGAMREFNDWTDKNFKFTVKVERSRGHVSLLIKEHDAVDYCNITDKGFGYSQVLPIILALWQILMSIAKKDPLSERRTKIIAFEQPELHLHPKLQAMVMDAIVAIVRKALELNFDLKFIIETHSPVMVNRLGLRIAKENSLREHSTVLLFDEGNQKNPTVASFDNGGYLLNWPLGFLEPDLD